MSYNMCRHFSRRNEPKCNLSLEWPHIFAVLLQEPENFPTRHRGSMSESDSKRVKFEASIAFNEWKPNDGINILFIYRVQCNLIHSKYTKFAITSAHCLSY